LREAIEKSSTPIHPAFDLLPSEQSIRIGSQFQRSKDTLQAISSEEHRKQAAITAAASLRNARVFFEQATHVTEEIRPILYYYGGMYFLDFVTSVVVRRQRVGNPGHGLSVVCDENAEFNRCWTRNYCSVEMGPSGDFPFYVDALTVAGWPSYFSGFRLHRDTKIAPWEVRENPLPLLQKEKLSLDLLCNFDRKIYLERNPALEAWLAGADSEMIWKTTSLLLDFATVFVASSLARYYVEKWRNVIEAEKSSVYNDIRNAFSGVSEGLPYFFEDEDPFQYSFGTRIAR
jgi:hypothetical protein